MLLHWLKALFIDELLVFIQPQRVVLMRLSRPMKQGFKPQLIHKKVIDLPENSAGLDEIEALEQCLLPCVADPVWQGAMPIIIISNAMTRYTVIPWDAALAVAQERQAYLKHFFNLAYGDVTKQWNLQMSVPEFGHAAIASGMHLHLLNMLKNVFTQSGYQRIAVYPQLMLTINQTILQAKKYRDIGHKKTALTFWLVAIQGGRVCIALLENGGWRTVKNVAIAHDLSSQVAGLIQREMLHCQLNVAAPVFVYWPASSSDQPLDLPNMKSIKVKPHAFDWLNHQTVSQLPSWASS